MALIGEMQYLTIGGSTYSIPTGTTVEVERNLTSGTKSATIKVDGTSYDLYAPTPNAGTVTSVRVQATSPVQSSTSTAQSSSLNTTISLANGYGDTKNPYGTKTKNYVLAGPTTGSDAAPTFRALVAADIPDLSDTYLTSYTETDPVYSASAASGITSSDISNWNSKTSNTGTITSVKTTAGAHTTINVSSGAVNFNVPTATSHLTNDSGFSTTDEKLKINAVSDTSVYYPIFGSNSTSAASTQLYDSNFKYQSATGATLTLGSLNGKMGSWHIFRGGYYINLQPATLTSKRTIYLPDKAGTIALTSDIPTVSYPVTSVNNKTGAVSLTASDVGALASSTTYVSTITTTAGTHSAISNQSGAVSFNVPTKTSHLTNDSGFLTSYTETDPVFSASAAAGITSTDISNWNAKSDTDEKVKAIALPTTSATYYLVLGSNSGNAETKNYSNKLTFNYSSKQVVLKVGDTTNGQKGRIYLYGSSAAGVTYLDTAATISQAITLPDASGTIALTSDIPTVPTITLNGTSTTTPSFYAPTTAGTNGYFLKSNGSGAPTWAEIETTAAQIVRW